jgi:UDP-glucose 4-epimerase
MLLVKFGRKYIFFKSFLQGEKRKIIALPSGPVYVKLDVLPRIIGLFMAKILVVGGAGYIGSHMVLYLQENGYRVTIFDSLITGHKDALPDDVELVVGDLCDREAIKNCLIRGQFDAVMHFGSLIQVGESVIHPSKYYHNNLFGGINLLDAMVEAGVANLIFSSSAAVYGVPKVERIGIDQVCQPINPYGASKYFLEKIISDYQKAYQLKAISLRYFNACGADPKGRVGERHNPETHLIPLVLQVASGRKKELEVYGNDYQTKDGTCIRDYIHVFDLCNAHLLALQKLWEQKEVSQSSFYNLGIGNGFSVLEVIKEAHKVTGKSIPLVWQGRRAGDPAVLVADPSAAMRDLGWKPIYPDLKTMISHAWEWENASTLRQAQRTASSALRASQAPGHRRLSKRFSAQKIK